MQHGFGGVVGTVFATLALAVLAQQGCDDVIDATKLRIQPHSYDFDDIPTGDRSAYPPADATVTCRIGSTGGLADCVSSLREVRGEWLVRKVRFWKVHDTSLHGCQIAGRQVRFQFQFGGDELSLRFRKGPRWERPLNP
jgi:hypothetical protein